MALRYICTFSLALIFVPSVSSAQSASSDVSWVISGRAGAAFPAINVIGTGLGNTGLDIGGSVGLQAGDFVRWDTVEVSWFGSAQFDPFFLGNYNALAFFIGSGSRIGYFGPRWAVHPYVSFGVGAAAVTIDTFAGQFVQWNFEWSIGAGVEVPISDRFSLGARYRYRSTPNDLLVVGATLSLHTIGVELTFVGP